MKPKTQEALNHARRLYQQKKYKEAADYVYENRDPEDQDEPPACVSFFEGECFEKLKEPPYQQMAIDCFKNAYLSSIGENIRSLQLMQQGDE